MEDGKVPIQASTPTEWRVYELPVLSGPCNPGSSPLTTHGPLTHPRVHTPTHTLLPGEVSPKASSGLEEQSGWPGPHEGLAGPPCSLALHPPGPTSDGQPLSSLVVEFYPFLPGQFTQPRSSLEENFPHRILGPKGQHPDSRWIRTGTPASASSFLP